MGSFYMEATQINYRRDETLKTVDQKLQELSEESAVDTDIAPVFSKTATYNPGDLVYYKNKLYVCNTQHSGAWAAGDFTATTVSGRITATDEAKADNIDLAPAFNSESSYAAGDLVTYNGTVYRCTNDHTGAWDAGDFSATTISAELDSLKSGLTNVDVALSVPENTGKNVLPLSLATIKSLNTDGTWASNVYTLNNVDFTVNTDANGNITSITVNGTATGGNSRLILVSGGYKVGGYILNGCPTNTDLYRLRVLKVSYPYTSYADNTGGDTTISNDASGTNIEIHIQVNQDKTADNVAFYPMIRPATITDATFAPYIPSVESRLNTIDGNLYGKLNLNLINGTSIYDYLRDASTPVGLTACDVQGATDNPVTGTTSYALVYKGTSSGSYSCVQLISGSGLYRTTILMPSDSSLTFVKLADAT